jgi:alpha-beta hydrolase superfamily lysophospholipase
LSGLSVPQTKDKDKIKIKTKENFFKSYSLDSLQNVSMVVGSESLTRFPADASCKIIYEQDSSENSFKSFPLISKDFHCPYNKSMRKETFEHKGLKLAGVWHEAGSEGAPAAVISHGFAGSKDSEKWKRVCEGLAAAGISAFRFDHSGIGESEGKFEDIALTGRAAELVAAAKFIAGRFGACGIALIGSSFGGLTALAAADAARPFCSVICATPFNFDFFPRLGPEYSRDGDYINLGDGTRVKRALETDAAGHDIPAMCARASRLLVCHGSDDELIPCEHAERIHARAGEPKKIEIIPGADHAFTRPEHREIFLSLCLDWIKRFA